MLDPKIKNNRSINASLSAFMYNEPPFHTKVRANISAQTIQAHYHDFPQLWYCRKGEYIHETQYGQYRGTPGSLVIVPPGVLHGYVVPEGQTVTVVRLDFAMDYAMDIPFESAPNTVTALCLPPFLRQLGIPRKEFYQLSEATQDMLETVLDAITDLKMGLPAKRNLVEQFFSQPEFAQTDAEKEIADKIAHTRLYPVLRVLSYIDANYGKKITAEQLGEVALLCRTNLFASIKQYLGIPYSAYLTMIRVLNANIALIHTNYSLAYISDMCGFFDSSHMGKCYKKYRGCLPKADRTKQQQYQDNYGKLRITQEFFMNDFYE